MTSLDREAEVERSPLYISPGYVAGPGELVVLFAGCLVMLGLMFLMLNDVIDVPPVPQELVLQRAHVTQPLDSSRSTAYLYIKVGGGEDSYDYVIRMFNDDAQSLNVKKFQALWVGVDPHGDSRFVWSLYDDRLKLMLGEQSIVDKAVYDCYSNWFMAVVWFLGFCWCAFNMLRCGIWNRYYYKRA